MANRTNTLSRVAPFLPLLLSVACASSNLAGETTPVVSPTPAASTSEGTALGDAVSVFAAGNHDVAFPADGMNLVGKLSIPQGATNVARVPAVVLVHGSGPNSRSPSYEGQLNMGFGFGVPVFEQLTKSLVDAGFAVLAYDKRSCGKFNECAQNDYPMPTDAVMIDTFVSDVQSAVNYLRTLDQVDAAHVFIVGHSQGGKIALEVLQRGTGASAGVMLAANHRPVDAMLEYQVSFAHDLLREAGLPEAQITSALAPAVELRNQAQAARRGEVGDANARFLRSWIELDDRTVAGVAQMTRPVLAIGGGYDWNVPADDVRAWEASFSAARNKGHKAVLVECVTHVLNCISQPDPKKITPTDIGREVHPPVAALVVDFLRVQTGVNAHE